VNLSQLLHRKGQTYAPPYTDERSPTIGRFYDAPLNDIMLSLHIYPAVGQRGEIDIDCLYTHHPSRRLDLHSPLALRLATAELSPNLIDNSYITGVHSTYSTTTIAFMTHLYVPDATPDEITNIIAAQLDDTHNQGIQTSSSQLQATMTTDSFTDIHNTTFLDNEPIASGTYLTSKHLEGTPHAHVITLPPFSPATYGLALLASKQLRWATTIPQTCIPTWILDILRLPLLNQTPTITGENVDRLTPVNDTCTIHNTELQGINAILAFRLFRAAAILTLYRHLSAVEHRQHNNMATSID
jgi:hypothetical protein